MKKDRSPIIIVLVILWSLFGCIEEVEFKTYKDEYSTLYTFLEDNSNFSYYKLIVDAALIPGSEQTMRSVYGSVNPYDSRGKYTLFLPGNDQIDSYLNKRGITLDELLANPEDCWDITTHHLLHGHLYSNDFPNGELEETSLNGASHAILYVSTDTGVVYLLDETASVLEEDLEQNNGIIHIIDDVLTPFSYTTCEWLSDNGAYQIFVDALRSTGLYDYFQSLDVKTSSFSMFVEADSIFNKVNIYNLQNLVDRISPENSDYTNSDNPLYQFVAYHVVESSVYLADFDQTNSYSTYASYPLTVAVDPALSIRDAYFTGIGINQGRTIYDTLISAENDTTLINYISIFREPSNRPTLNGALHFINYVMEVDSLQTPSNRYFFFTEDPALSDVKKNGDPGYYTYMEHELSLFEFGGNLQSINYYWTDDVDNERAHSNDYIEVEGFYSLAYNTSEIVAGDYNLYFHINSNASGFIDVYVDDQKVGGTINLSTIEASSSTNPYRLVNIGTVRLNGYTGHQVRIQAITPGFLIWDYILFFAL